MRQFIIIIIAIFFMGFSPRFSVEKTSQREPSVNAVNALSKYLKKDEQVYSFIRIISPAKSWTEIVSIVPKNHNPLKFREVLCSWMFGLDPAKKDLFPVFPVQENGLIDLDDLEYRIRQAGLIAWIDLVNNNPSSPHHLDSEMVNKVELIYQEFFGYHLFDDPQLGYSDALEGMLSDIALENMGIDESSLSEVLNITAKTVEHVWHTGSWVAEKWSSAKANEIWNAAFNLAKESGNSFTEATKLADKTSRFWDRIWFYSVKYKKLGNVFSIGIAQGSAVMERVLAALTPIIFIEEAEQDLVNIRGLMGDTKEERLLCNAIDLLLPRIRGEVDIFVDKLIQSLMNQEFIRDMAIPALHFVAKFIAGKAAGWGIPFIGKALIALDVGFFLGDFLSNNPAVSKEFESAKYTKDIEDILHQIAFERLYPELQKQNQRNAVEEKNIEVFDSAVRLTILSESYFWKKVIKGFNSTGPVKNIFDKFFRGITGPEIAQSYLLEAETTTKSFAEWCKPRVAQKLMQVTLERMGIKTTSPGTSLALIIDSTGSMTSNDPNNARIFGGELVLDQGEDIWEMGIVDFDASSKLLDSGSPQDKNLRDTLSQIDSSGTTNIQAGLEEGFNYLESVNKEKKGAILLTDGQHNTPSRDFDYSKYVDIFTQKRWPVYTIGLTGDANAVLLSKIASMTGGIYLKAETYQDMVGIMDLILSQFKWEALISHYKDRIKQGEIKEFAYWSDNSVESLNYSGTYQGSKVDFGLVDPKGMEISQTDPSKRVEVIEGRVYKIIKVKNPIPGMWKAKAVGVEVRGEEPFEIKISADTPIKVEMKEAKPVYVPYEPIRFQVDVAGDVDKSSLSYSIEVQPPEGDIEKIHLGKDLLVQYSKTDKPGVYYFNIEVEGKKMDGERFEREGIKHIVVASTGKEFGVGEVVRARGSYLDINLGREIGLSVGKKIYVFVVEGGIKRMIAEGYVISVFQGRSIVELTSSWGGEIPKKGNRVEVDRSEF